MAANDESRARTAAGRWGFRLWTGVALLLGATALVTGCPSKEDDTAGTGGTGTGATGSGATGGAGGGGASACVKYRKELCTQMEQCAPHVFAQAWETADICLSEAERLCDLALPSALDDLGSGVADADGCYAAISGSCDAYLGAIDHPPAACQPNPGLKALGEGCVTSAQCAAGLTCHASDAPTCTRYCAPVGEIGTPCKTGGDALCDASHDLLCIADACSVVTYGALGTACDASTGALCASGLGCAASGANQDKCIALLGEGATCDPASTIGDPCDHRLALSCQLKDPANANLGRSCQAPHVVPVNAACGLVQGVQQECSAYAYCNNAGVCARKTANEGDGCVVGGCYPPYDCVAGTCHVPTLIPDPTCNEPPVAEVACGATESCLDHPCCEATAATGGADTCSATTACSNTQPTALTCDNSDQCSNGDVCCLDLTWALFIGSHTLGDCRPSAQCKTPPICTDGPWACGGTGTCLKADDLALDWSFLPSSVGFCAEPTCAPHGALGACPAGTTNPPVADATCCTGQCFDAHCL